MSPSSGSAESMTPFMPDSGAPGRSASGSTGALISVRDLQKIYKLEAGLFASASRWVWAVNGVSFDILRGETYGLVGESGSGKTTIARCLVQLVPHTSGAIEYVPDAEGAPAGEPARWEITRYNRELLRRFRSQVKYIFQDPSSALDPRMSVFDILSAGSRREAPRSGAAELRARAAELTQAVGLREADPPRRPSEFSGGQRQRISLARALFSNPRALICDEVVSALDVSIQGQILNLLVDLKQEYRLSILFIAHDLVVVSYMADRVGVLYGGSLMEEAPSADLTDKPLHPYTQLLYRTVPRLGAKAPDRGTTAGTPFNATRAPTGCPFAGRCPLEQEICRHEKPPLREVSPGHRVACHFVS
jgi:peptide/nickel transport system ATP-binding protein